MAAFQWVLVFAMMLSCPLQSRQDQQSLFYSAQHAVHDVELENPTAEWSWIRTASNAESSAGYDVLACAHLCLLRDTCSGFSHKEVGGNFTCKTAGSAIHNNTRNAPGAMLMVRFLVGSDGYTEYLDPFRFKMFAHKSNSPSDASNFCLSEGGTAIPVGYPHEDAHKTLQFFMGSLPTTTTIFLGIQLSKVNPNGSLEFRTLRDWPLFAEPGTTNPTQPWARGQPSLPPFDKPSDIAVMMSSDGWFTADTRSTISDVTVCMKHATYEFLKVTMRFHRGWTDKQIRSNAELRCAAEGGFLARAYGQQGRDLVTFYMNQRSLPINTWLAGVNSPPGSSYWSFPDGLVLNFNNRGTDSRQNWNNIPGDPGNQSNCIQEVYKKWWATSCDYNRVFLCEGGF